MSPLTYCHAFNRCCRKAVSIHPLASCIPSSGNLPGLLTCGPPALCLLLLLAVRVLAGDRVRLLDLCLRHGKQSALFRGAGVVKRMLSAGRSLMRFAAEVAVAFRFGWGLTRQPRPILDLTAAPHLTSLATLTKRQTGMSSCIRMPYNDQRVNSYNDERVNSYL